MGGERRTGGLSSWRRNGRGGGRGSYSPASPPEHLKPLVEFALLCGQRKAKKVSLRWADVDLESRCAKLSVKGGGVYTIPLSWRMVEIIEA